MSERIIRFSRFFRAIFAAILVATPVIVCILWLTGGSIHFENANGEAVFELMAADLLHDSDIARVFPLSWDIRVLAMLVSMIPAGVLMLSMWWLVRLFGYFAGGEFFSGDTVRYIRYLGWTMIGGAVAGPVYEALLSLVLTMHNPPGEHMLVLSSESADFEQLLTGGIIILVSWIMDEGRKLREAEELTV